MLTITCYTPLTSLTAPLEPSPEWVADCERMILEADLAERSEEVRLMSERIEQLEDALVRLAVQCSEAQTRFVALKEAYDAIAWRQA